MTVDLQFLQDQIQKNCDISDANFSGSFSLCGLLLRMRDLYKWESGLAPWEEPEHGLLLDWVEQREEMWMGLEGRDCEVLEVNGGRIAPFEIEEVNTRLDGTGCLYGAGYVLGMKPSFFLATIVDETMLNGIKVYTVERELCRDIFVTPVMRQGGRIIARRQAMASLLWDVVLEQRPSVRPALEYVLTGYGMNSRALLQRPREFRSAYLDMVHEELRIWVHHEIGEALEDVFPGDVWHQMVADTSQTLAEVFIRAVKDLLADTHPQGLLAFMAANDSKRSLGLYLAMMRPISKLLFTDIFRIFPDFTRTGEWGAVERVRADAYARGRELARKLVEVHFAGDHFDHGHTVHRIIEEIVRPLGILGEVEADEKRADLDG